jgi:hypothetical protein
MKSDFNHMKLCRTSHLPKSFCYKYIYVYFSFHFWVFFSRGILRQFLFSKISPRIFRIFRLSYLKTFFFKNIISHLWTSLNYLRTIFSPKFYLTFRWTFSIQILRHFFFETFDNVLNAHYLLSQPFN